MQYRLVNAIRSALTITGLVLLVIFGTRAAAQADDMKLAGGHNSGLPVYVLHKLQNIAELAGGSTKAYASTIQSTTPTIRSRGVAEQTLQAGNAAVRTPETENTTMLRTSTPSTQTDTANQTSGNDNASPSMPGQSNSAGSTESPQSSAAEMKQAPTNHQRSTSTQSKKTNSTNTTATSSAPASSAASEHAAPKQK